MQHAAQVCPAAIDPQPVKPGSLGGQADVGRDARPQCLGALLHLDHRVELRLFLGMRP
ncbi:hypothetical protein [Leisingera sp.]|uniref:hypothetical protein n=1 Tax=Leisingera sp. TaxID=1879318 RepID=UPI003A8CD103